ncbi:unnamed protein product, partial [Choristocarpus tenellus]
MEKWALNGQSPHTHTPQDSESLLWLETHTVPVVVGELGCRVKVCIACNCTYIDTSTGATFVSILILNLESWNALILSVNMNIIVISCICSPLLSTTAPVHLRKQSKSRILQTYDIRSMGRVEGMGKVEVNSTMLCNGSDLHCCEEEVNTAVGSLQDMDFRREPRGMEREESEATKTHVFLVHLHHLSFLKGLATSIK